MPTFDAGTISATAELDRSPFVRSLRELEREGDRFARRTYKASAAIETAAAEQSIMRLQRRLNALRGASVGVNVTGNQAQLAQTETVVRNLDGRSININVRMNGAAQAMATLTSLDQLARRLDGRAIRIRADMDSGGALAQFATLQSRLSAMSGRAIRINVQMAGVSQAIAQLTALDAVVRRLDGRTIRMRVDVDTGGALARLTALQGRMTTLTNTTTRLGGAMNRTTRSGSGFGGMLANLLAVALAVAPALVPLGAALVANTTGLVVGFGLAGVAAGAFGVAAQGAVGRAGSLASAVEKSSAEVHKQREALKQLTPGTAEYAAQLKVVEQAEFNAAKAKRRYTGEYRAFNAAMETMMSQYSRMITATAPATLTPMTEGIRGAAEAVRRFIPLINAVSPVAMDVARAFRQWVNTKLDGWIGFLVRNGIPALRNLVTFGKNVIAMLGNLVKAFAPLSGDMMNGLARWGASMRSWSENGGFTRFLDRVRDNAPLVREFMRNLLDALSNIMEAFRGLGPLSLGLLTTILRLVAALPPSWIQAIVVGFVAWRTVMMGMLIVSAVARAFRALQTAVIAVRTAWFLLNLVFAGSPIGLIITAVVALVAGIVYLATQTRFFQTVWNAVWNAVKIAAEAVWNALKIAWSATINALITAWNAVGSALRTAWTAVWNGIRAAGQAVWNAIRAAWQFVINGIRTVTTTYMAIVRAAWTAAWNGIRAAGQAVWNAIRTAWNAVINGIRNTTRAVMATVRSVWSAGWNAVRAAGQAVWNALRAAWTAVMNTIRTTTNTVLNAIRNLWRTVWNGIRTAAVAVWNAMRAAVNAFMNAIRNIFNTVLNAIRTIWRNVWNAIRTAAQAVWNALRTAANAFMNNMRNIFNAVLNAIRTIWRNVWNSIRQFITALWNGLRQAANNFMNAVRNTFNAVMNAIRTLWNRAWSQIRDTAKRIWDAIKRNWDAFIKSVREAASKFVDWIKDRLKKGWEAIRDTAKKLWNNILTVIGKAIQAVITVANKLIGGFNNVAKALKIPVEISPIPKLEGYAKGGIVAPVKYAFGGMVGNPPEHFARGGVVNLRMGGALAGYAPGKDTVPAMLSPGEGVLTPEAVRGLGGAGFVNSANRTFAGHRGAGKGAAPLNKFTGHHDIAFQNGLQTGYGRGYATGGMVVPHFAIGGLVSAALARAGGGFSITQGEYSNSVAASAGTHSGGGVVDIAAGPGNGPAMVARLRSAGWAAWLRTPSEGFAYHIHAVLMNHPNLSPQARSQVASYLAGGNGLANGGPDTGGGPGGLAGLFGDIGGLLRDIAQGKKSEEKGNIFSDALGFLTGGLLGTGGDTIGKMLLGSVTKAALDTAFDWIKFVHPGAGMAGDIFLGMGKKMLAGAKDFIFGKSEKAREEGAFDFSSIPGGAPAGGVASWRPMAALALAKAGLGSGQLGAFMSLMQAESGGNPGAINLYDSNAKMGQASRGLMQVIPSTFAAYRDPSLSNNIMDPMANMVAAARYIKARYGGRVPGSPYYTGTLNATAGLHTVAERGPELVLSPGMREFQGGERVFNAGDTRRILAGGRQGAQTVRVDMPKTLSLSIDGQQFTAYLEAETRETIEVVMDEANRSR